MIVAKITYLRPRSLVWFCRSFLFYVVQELLELLGMPVLRAKHEAEGLCAELQKQGLVNACVTPDSDAFLYGAEHVIKILQADLKVLGMLGCLGLAYDKIPSACVK